MHGHAVFLTQSAGRITLLKNNSMRLPLVKQTSAVKSLFSEIRIICLFFPLFVQLLLIRIYSCGSDQLVSFKHAVLLNSIKGVVQFLLWSDIAVPPKL